MSNTAPTFQQDVSSIARKLERANSIILTTHKQCDGDGLGAILGLYHALKHTDKTVRVLLVDEIPAKYSFLDGEEYAEIFEGPHEPVKSTDMCLIFDTNDFRLVEPLWETLVKNCDEVLFVDHHPILSQGPLPTEGSYINTNAASTGEVAYYIIQEMGLPLDEASARALYTSIAFDTQLFRYVKSRPNSHLVAAELLKLEKNPEIIHKEIFSTYTVGKMKFLSEALGDIEYHFNEKVAVLHIRDGQLKNYSLDIDDSRDVIDMIMNITSVEAAALFREDAPGEFKMSLRSKGKAEVISIAEEFGGGGHRFAAGAPTRGNYQEIKNRVVELLIGQLKKTSPSESKDSHTSIN
tara:strand:- start:48415 stop:49467 length:1053 start_codon:yes stop_codon:yes gene_type:complete